MSLIERAVERLGKKQRTEPALPAQDDGIVDRPTTIDAYAERLAAPAAAVAPASVPSPVHAPPAARSAPASTPALASSPASSPTSAPSPAPIRIHLESLRAAGFVTPASDQTPALSQFRVIKRPLVNNAFGRQNRPAIPNGKRVMVTSSFPGEGKSFCAVNLAMSIAVERDHQVILIDADVARPSLPRVLGIPPGEGLLDWLAQDRSIDLAELVLPTNVDSLSVIRAGTRHEHATELLASSAMSQLLDELSARYPDALMIFDSPPLLVTTESRVVASYMGQIVLVVEAGKTSRESVNEALSTIESCEVIGLVLNKAHKLETQGYYQGYGYGYGYGQGPQD
jgi:exopolysaccharide/PEP-CTERM locus tyrosine autokinase